MRISEADIQMYRRFLQIPDEDPISNEELIKRVRGHLRSLVKGFNEEIKRFDAATKRSDP